MINITSSDIFLFIVISIAMSASVSLIWAIFYLLSRRNIEAGFHLFCASFIGGVLGSIPGMIIGILTGFIYVKIIGSDPGFVDWSGLYMIPWMIGFWILGVLVGASRAGKIILEDYQ